LLCSHTYAAHRKRDGSLENPLRCFIPGDALPRALSFWAVSLDTVLATGVPVGAGAGKQPPGYGQCRPASLYGWVTEPFPQSLCHTRNGSQSHRISQVGMDPQGSLGFLPSFPTGKDNINTVF